MTKLSNWITYGASYLPLAVYQLIRISIEICQNSKYNSLKDKITNLSKGKMFILLMSFLLVIDFIIFAIVTKKLKPNERIYGRISKNITFEMAGFLLLYILSAFTIDNDIWGLIINIIGFVILGFVFNTAEIMHLCPSYFFIRYRLYEIVEGEKILVRLSREKYNLIYDDSRNGIEAKQLSSNTHLVQIR